MLPVFPHPNLKRTTRYSVSFTRTSNSPKCKKIYMLHVMLSVLLSLYQEMELFGRFVTESEFPEMLLHMNEVCQIGSNILKAAPICAFYTILGVYKPKISHMCILDRKLTRTCTSTSDGVG